MFMVILGKYRFEHVPLATILFFRYDVAFQDGIADYIHIAGVVDSACGLERLTPERKAFQFPGRVVRVKC